MYTYKVFRRSLRIWTISCIEDDFELPDSGIRTSFCSICSQKSKLTSLNVPWIGDNPLKQESSWKHQGMEKTHTPFNSVACLRLP